MCPRFLLFRGQIQVFRIIFFILYCYSKNLSHFLVYSVHQRHLLLLLYLGNNPSFSNYFFYFLLILQAFITFLIVQCAPKTLTPPIVFRGTIQVFRIIFFILYCYSKILSHFLVYSVHQRHLLLLFIWGTIQVFRIIFFIFY